VLARNRCLSCRYNFTVRQQEVEQLKAISLEQINKFYTQCIPLSAEGRRCLAVHVVSNSHVEETVEPGIEDLDRFKEDLQLCALPFSSSLAK
jgi:secreted Zn-dependent insulinase-like peptidase